MPFGYRKQMGYELLDTERLRLTEVRKDIVKSIS